jgi:hypothetical protein
VEFLKEVFALWRQRQTIRVIRADSGFFDDELLSFLEERRLPYLVVARMTKWVQRAAQRVEHGQMLDENYPGFLISQVPARVPTLCATLHGDILSRTGSGADSQSAASRLVGTHGSTDAG